MKKIRIILAIILILIPIVSTLIVWFAVKNLDWGAYIGAMLAYVGTATLGFVAYTQNDRLHKLERISKKSKIWFNGEFKYEEIKVEDEFIKKSKQTPTNYYLASDNENFKGEKMIYLTLPIKIEGYGLKYIEMHRVVVNEEEDNQIDLKLNEEVVTDLVYSVANKSHQIEICIICAELQKIKDLVNADDFILTLYYDTISCADVRTAYAAKLNVGNFNLTIKENGFYDMNNICYWEKDYD